MDDIKLAMLGNKEAAKRLTDAGVLVPCPGCGGNRAKADYCGCFFIECPDCEWYGPTRTSEHEARLAWNTRAPILSAEEMEMLEGLE